MIEFKNYTNKQLIASIVSESGAIALFKNFGDDIDLIAQANILQLENIVGKAKAEKIAAIFELGRRRNDLSKNGTSKVSTSNDLYEFLKTDLVDLDHEELWLVTLNRANRIIGKFQLSIGGTSGTVADPKIIFRVAIENKASNIVVAHNHPSGNLKPSTQDIALTKKIKAGAELLDIQLLDHLIISHTGYYSFSDSGLL